MFEDAIKEFAKSMAKWMIPSATGLGYNVAKFSLGMSISSNKNTFNQMIMANRQSTEENLKGKAGNAALSAIDRIKSNDDFSKGVDSIR